jgi:cytochrome c oxidase assembly factor CtaG
VTGWVADERPGGQNHDESQDRGGARIGQGSGGARLALAASAAVLLIAALVPPLSSAARRVEALEALQFALLAMGVPALVALSAPWRLLGLAAGRTDATDATDAEGTVVLERPQLADRMAAGRRRHPELARSLAYLAVDTAVVVAWRIPAGVDALARHGWLSVVEAVTLVAVGVGLWLELIESPPFAPRLARPKRIALAAIAMWTIWVTAYLVGLSHASVYRAYAHVAGRDLSVSADQVITTGVLWFTSLCAFLPVIFSNFVIWLRSDEDPDDALYRLVRDGRRSTGELPAGERSDGRHPFG